MYEKIDYGKTYGYKDFITEETRVHLLEYARKFESIMSVNGPKKMFQLENTPEFSKDMICEFRKKIVELEGLVDYKEPTLTKNFFAEYGKDSECNVHMDPTREDDYIHIRYNIMLSKPDRGGQTIYGDDFLDIDERVLWKCNSEHYQHGSDTVLSNKPRSIISMGFLIHKDEI
jgi:ribosomal protein S18